MSEILKSKSCRRKKWSKSFLAFEELSKVSSTSFDMEGQSTMLVERLEKRGGGGGREIYQGIVICSVVARDANSSL